MNGMNDETKSGNEVKDTAAGVGAIQGVVANGISEPKLDDKGGKAPTNTTKATKPAKAPSKPKKPAMKVTAKVVKPAKSIKPVKPAKPVKPVKVVKSLKVGKTGKVVKVAKPAKPTKAAKPNKTEKASTVEKVESKDGNPYRSTSSYGKLWAILSKHKDKGISRADLIKEGMKVIGKPEKNTGYDVAVVVSPSQDGSAHRSANKAADHYWVERDGGLLKLHMR